MRGIQANMLNLWTYVNLYSLNALYLLMLHISIVNPQNQGLQR
ncbi:hypothetical protein NIES3585_47760 [Nodularia sp. NIES-3585]|nr:hypothetical protein NIES3585_47760 [Nodularia sp. NIES-3585]